ncbi:hypothetical protein HanXRQr2_Chr09g0409571 [Helianthus annuus]|uniref:Ulp1 protease family, C-terminal catalytic domain-containing protein n=1 Tax=Helianthus annuus TaxID=4232 RepID=A0A9K3NAK2_HELAN|nr:hypothetical protein HanXRQr2_Chr09g0409571 [Helianthus annuus]
MARSRPQNIYGLVQKVALQYEKALFMGFTWPTGMYKERVQETIEFEVVIQLCVNGWVDVCFVHWFTMEHWVLIILQHHPVYKTWKGYIFDSRKGKNDNDYSCYEITTLFKQAIEQNMTWAKVKVSSDSSFVVCLFLYLS